MNKLILGAALFALSLSLFPQQLSHDVSVINIEIPVRVFKEGTFVDSLTIKDFEVYEDGKLQKAVDASENYYLLYYSPEDYRRDGKFRKIEVRVKDKNYSISHRAGYFAN